MKGGIRPDGRVDLEEGEPECKVALEPSAEGVDVREIGKPGACQYYPIEKNEPVELPSGGPSDSENNAPLERALLTNFRRCSRRAALR